MTEIDTLKATIASLEAERDKWRALEKEAATYVETVICCRTGFTGEPPHVGWKGLGLALTEALDERDRLREALRRYVDFDTEADRIEGLDDCDRFARTALGRAALDGGK
jgi:hypothetical protein